MGDHGVGIERGDDIVDDFLLGQAKLTSVYAVDVRAEPGIVQVLRNVNLANPWQASYAARQVFCHVVGLLQVPSADLDVDRRLHS